MTARSKNSPSMEANKTKYLSFEKKDKKKF